MTDIDQRHVSALVTNPETLHSLTPAAVATYLVRAGWTRMGGRNAGTVWARRFDGGVGHLFQPEDPTCPDYALRTSEMLAALAGAESRADLAILADLCGADHVAGTLAEERATAGRTDWMEPEYGLRRPELALMLDLAACRVEREAFVLELERLDWPRAEADELADLVAECELIAAESARATDKAGKDGDGLG
jgi:hypothetical protein